MQIKNKNYKYLNGKNLRAGIVVARFNQEVTDKLLENALVTLKKCKIEDKGIKVLSVAGAIEIPLALQKMARSGKYDFLVALACVIRGDTSHFDYVCKMIQEGIIKVMLDESISIGFGVLTTDTFKQAKSRYHVGGEAVLAALELSLLKL